MGSEKREPRVRPARAFGFLFAAVVLCLGFAGCGSQDSSGPPPVSSAPLVPSDGDQPPPAAGKPKLTLSAPQPAAITAGSTGAVIQAKLVDAEGAALKDQTVTFKASPSSVAQLSPAGGAAKTDASGVAQITVLGLKSGTATVSASAAGADSAQVNVGVLPPKIALGLGDPAEANIQAGPATGPGATLVATVTDQDGKPLSGETVTFVADPASFGQVGATTSPAAGEYRAKLTSQLIGAAVVRATVRGAESTESVAITVGPGPVATLTLTPSPNQIKKAPTGTASSTIGIKAVDAFQNPISAAVTLASTPADTGSLTATSVTLDAKGEGQAEFVAGAGQVGTAAITGSVGGVALATATIQVIIDRAGEPANIFSVVEPLDGRITVAGVGGNERARLTITVVDIAGDPIVDVPSNLELHITKAPGNSAAEKPFLDGQDPVTGVLTLTTTGGIASANLQAGIRPGTVEITVRVIRGKDGSLLAPPLQAVLPQITIEAGPPFSVFLSPSNSVTSTGKGTITHEYFAVVSDQYGNAVTDGTSVFFGQFLNIIQECRHRWNFVSGSGFVEELCPAGRTTLAQDGSFTDTGAGFQTKGVRPGDTFVPITEFNQRGYGGYAVDSVTSETQLRIETGFDQADAGIEYAVGNNGNLGGAVFTPGEVVPTEAGIARWPNTYSGELINNPVYIYAETGGKGLGHARWFDLAWVAPTKITVAGPDKFPLGTTAGYTLLFTDGSSPTPYAIADLVISVSVPNGVLAPASPQPHIPVSDNFQVSPSSSYLRTSSRDITLNYRGGEVAFTWTPSAAGTLQMFISGGGALVKLEVKVE